MSILTLSVLAFYTISHNILVGMVRKCGLEEWSVRWIENWLNSRAQGIVISGADSNLRPGATGVPQGSALSTVLFNLFIKDMGKGTWQVSRRRGQSIFSVIL